MTTNSDFQQYAAVHDALAWRAEAEAAHVARRVEAVSQVVHALLACPCETGDDTILVCVPVATWRTLAELVAVLPPEYDRG